MTARLLALLALGICALSAAPAEAQGSTADTLKDWGLLGSWATRCDQPPSLSNPRYRFVAAADGRAYQERDFADPSRNDRSDIVSGELLGDGTLALSINFASVGQTRLNVYAKSEGRVRVMFNRGPGGEVSVENGILRHNGQPTAWWSKCG